MLSDVVKEIFPPDLKPLQRYRIFMSALLLVLILDTAAGRGAFAWMGVDKYASGEKAQQLVAKVDAILILQIQERMRNIHRELCFIEESGARIVLENEIANLQESHRLMAGTYYPLSTTCPSSS